MGLERHLVSIFFLWFCYNSCDGRKLEDPLSNWVDDALPYDDGPYTTYFSAIDDDEHELRPELMSVIDFEPAISEFKRLDDVGSPQSSDRVVNVDDFGAKGDGADDTKAFEAAWEEACSSAPSVLMVSENKNYLLKPIIFSGPCRSSIRVLISGTLEASSNRSDWNGQDQKHWLVFREIDNLRVEGHGTINGNGKIWWENSCKINKTLPCEDAPTALSFYSCRHLIMNCMIGTGDDCISLVGGSQNVTATNITCGPGHGISIGSLGNGKSEDHVAMVTVNGAKFFGTTNGVRIKTWQGGSGNASNIKFQNIDMRNVTRPIVIDQYYCDSMKPCPSEQQSAVEVSNVVYKSITGTSASEVALTFHCSKNFPCHDIVLQDINLVGNGGEPTTGSCKNIKGISAGTVYPHPCF
ncbi:hypothetical protein AAC387_Pa05g2177 [Persea americana]